MLINGSKYKDVLMTLWLFLAMQSVFNSREIKENDTVYILRAYRNSWTLDRSFERWALDARLWTMGSGRWALLLTGEPIF